MESESVACWVMLEDSRLSWLLISASRNLVASDSGPLGVGEVRSVKVDCGRGDVVDDLDDGSSGWFPEARS